MKYLLLFTLTLFLANPVFAAVDRQVLGLSTDGEVAQIQAKGLVCDFCAQALDKMFKQNDAVEAINVDLSTKLIHVNFKPGKTIGDKKLTEIIEDAGYNVAGIKRFDA